MGRLTNQSGPQSLRTVPLAGLHLIEYGAMKEGICFLSIPCAGLVPLAVATRYPVQRNRCNHAYPTSEREIK